MRPLPPALAGAGGVLALLAAWELAVRAGALEYEYLPAPSTIAAALAALIPTAAFGEELAHTLAATLGGWAIASAGGILAGAVLGLSRRARRFSLASIEMLRPLPAVAFVPVALLLFGFSIQMELFVIVLPALWPALVNTMGGVAAVPERLHDVARTLHMPPFAAALRVLLPAAAAPVMVGCRLSLSLALVMAVVAEMTGNPLGLGYALVREQQALHPDVMFAYVFVIGLLGIALNGALSALGRLALPGEFLRRTGQWQRAR